MKSIIIYSFLIFLTGFISAQTIPDSITVGNHITHYTDSDSMIVEGHIVRNILIQTAQVGYLKQISFGDRDKGFIITFENGNIGILYGKETKPNEAVKQFFNWLKDYIKGEYYIIEKQSLKKLLQ